MATITAAPGALLTCSASGKVCIGGSYFLTMEPGRTGVLLSLDANFCTDVMSLDANPPAGVTLASDDAVAVSVHSVQYNETYDFVVAGSASAGVTVTQPEGAAPQPYLYFSLMAAFAHALAATRKTNVSELLPDGKRAMRIALRASNDFYQQHLKENGGEDGVEALRKLPPSCPLAAAGGAQKQKGNGHRAASVGAAAATHGFGSAGAMTMSFVAALVVTLEHLQPANPRSRVVPTKTVELIHRIAQVAHSLARGRVCSGFDVFASAYGTCAFSRIPAAKVEAAVEQKALGFHSGQQPTSMLPATIFSAVSENAGDEWAPRPGAFQMLPRKVNLLLASVARRTDPDAATATARSSAGTTCRVDKIFEWRKTAASGDAAAKHDAWEKLAASNAAFVAALEALLDAAEEDAGAYEVGWKRAASLPGSKWAAAGRPVKGNRPEDEDGKRTLSLFAAAFEAATACRAHLREVGKAAGVEVETAEVTALLDATLKLPGVLAVGCPGGSGPDVIFALVVGEEQLQCTAVEKFWEAREQHGGALDVCALPVRENASGLTVCQPHP
jgi:phosphomevalonate kinase